MAKWKHTCRLAWLQARQRYLTATDVKDLLPFTKTGRKRVIDDATYMKVMSRKLCTLTEADCKSYGAAARGHIMEPYAIDMFNRVYPYESKFMYHWDDMIVRDPHGPEYCLAFSPDGMDVPMVYDEHSSAVTFCNPTSIVEVKSYGADKHYACGITDKMGLEEKWQLASAMVVCDTIEKAYLLFFNPSVDAQMFIHVYDREDLEDEIKIIKQIVEDWIDWINNKFLNLPFAEMYSDKDLSEESIVNQIIEDEIGLPDNLKTVTRDD